MGFRPMEGQVMLVSFASSRWLPPRGRKFEDVCTAVRKPHPKIMKGSAMSPLVVLARIAGGLHTTAVRGDRSTYLTALLVLVLFVIWLLASGHDLGPAVLAAVGLSWAADRAAHRGSRRQVEEVDA
jgi:hypothetical protein